MNKVLEVKVFDFNTQDSNWGGTFDKDDISRFLSSPDFLDNLKKGRYLSYLTHRSRYPESHPMGSKIAEMDIGLLNNDIAGVLRKLEIVKDDLIGDIQLLPTSSGLLVDLLHKYNVQLGVSISFLNDPNRFGKGKYSISVLNGIDFTGTPAMSDSWINKSKKIKGYA